MFLWYPGTEEDLERKVVLWWYFSLCGLLRILHGKMRNSSEHRLLGMNQSLILHRIASVRTGEVQIKRGSACGRNIAGHFKESESKYCTHTDSLRALVTNKSQKTFQFLALLVLETRVP